MAIKRDLDGKDNVDADRSLLRALSAVSENPVTATPTEKMLVSIKTASTFLKNHRRKGIATALEHSVFISNGVALEVEYAADSQTKGFSSVGRSRSKKTSAWGIRPCATSISS